MYKLRGVDDVHVWRHIDMCNDMCIEMCRHCPNTCIPLTSMATAMSLLVVSQLFESIMSRLHIIEDLLVDPVPHITVASDNAGTATQSLTQTHTRAHTQQHVRVQQTLALPVSGRSASVKHLGVPRPVMTTQLLDVAKLKETIETAVTEAKVGLDKAVTTAGASTSL